MSHIRLQYHIVFSTKERRPMISEELMARLVPYIGGIIRDLGGQMLEAGGSDNHLHIATLLDQNCAMKDVLRKVKAGSSRWVHETFRGRDGFGWQDGYAAFTVSQSAMPQVVEYVRNQAEHHRKSSFEEEMLALLKAHGLNYDERYVFD